MAIKLVKAKVLDTDWWFILISTMLQLNRETMKKKLEKKLKTIGLFHCLVTLATVSISMILMSLILLTSQYILKA